MKHALFEMYIRTLISVNILFVMSPYLTNYLRFVIPISFIVWMFIPIYDVVRELRKKREVK